MIRVALFVNLVLLGLLRSIVLSAPIPSYTAKIVEKKIIIDGQLLDWQGLGASEESLNTPMRLSPRSYDPYGLNQFAGSDDLSANFQVISDADYLYVAVTVKDDFLTLGTQVPYGQAWKKDTVYIYLDGDLKNPAPTHNDFLTYETPVPVPYDRTWKKDTFHIYRNGDLKHSNEEKYDQNDSIILVTRNGDNDVSLEGHHGQIPSVPYLWKLMGVQAGLALTADGYTVELSIPASVLGFDKLKAGTTLGFNVAVGDCDGGLGREYKLGWIDNWVNGWKYRRTKHLGRLTIDGNSSTTKQFSLSKNTLRATTSIQEDGLVITFTGGPLRADIETMHYLRKGNLERGIPKLLDVLSNALPDSPQSKWAESTLAALHFKAHDFEQAMQIFSMVQSRNDPYISDWAAIKYAECQKIAGKKTAGTVQARDFWQQAFLAAITPYQAELKMLSLEQQFSTDRKTLPALSQTKIRTAISLCDSLVSQVPFSPAARLAAKNRYILQYLSGDSLRAERQLENYFESLDNNPHLVVPTLLKVVNAYRYLQKYGRALDLCAEALTKAPSIHLTAWAKLQTGHIYMALGDYDQAINFFEDIISTYPPSGDPEYIRFVVPQAYYSAAVCYREFAKPKKAIELLNYIQSVFPDSDISPRAQRLHQSIHENFEIN